MQQVELSGPLKAQHAVYVNQWLTNSGSRNTSYACASQICKTEPGTCGFLYVPRTVSADLCLCANTEFVLTLECRPTHGLIHHLLCSRYVEHRALLVQFFFAAAGVSREQQSGRRKLFTLLLLDNSKNFLYFQTLL